MILGNFADRHLATLLETQVDEFERLLDAPDQDVYAWITDQAPAPAEYDTQTLALISRVPTRDHSAPRCLRQP
ncbi:MAG: succinate dehydrogenase assembly factor 2 [Hyphomonadaceae bacterium JAD_PAG50586_4]|nr:MAG: succinate dehydrogenase assembly factor 2 [Hyphomonadaceae bacterium JAD_PAG50586_4]